MRSKLHASSDLYPGTTHPPGGLPLLAASKKAKLSVINVTTAAYKSGQPVSDKQDQNRPNTRDADKSALAQLATHVEVVWSDEQRRATITKGRIQRLPRCQTPLPPMLHCAGASAAPLGRAHKWRGTR